MTLLKYLNKILLSKSKESNESGFHSGAIEPGKSTEKSTEKRKINHSSSEISSTAFLINSANVDSCTESCSADRTPKKVSLDLNQLCNSCIRDNLASNIRYCECCGNKLKSSNIIHYIHTNPKYSTIKLKCKNNVPVTFLTALSLSSQTSNRTYRNYKSEIEARILFNKQNIEYLRKQKRIQKRMKAACCYSDYDNPCMLKTNSEKIKYRMQMANNVNLKRARNSSLKKHSFYNFLSQHRKTNGSTITSTLIDDEFAIRKNHHKKQKLESELESKTKLVKNTPRNEGNGQVCTTFVVDYASTPIKIAPVTSTPIKIKRTKYS